MNPELLNKPCKFVINRASNMDAALLKEARNVVLMGFFILYSVRKLELIIEVGTWER